MDSAHRFSGIAGPAMREMQRGPLFNQSLESEPRFGALALGLGQPAHALRLGIDPLRDFPKPYLRRLAGLINSDVAPDPDGLAHLAAGRRVGPLADEGAGSLHGHADAKAGRHA